MTTRGLYGLLFAALKEVDPEETDWLYDQPAPKPFSMAPLYAEGGALAGLRLGTISPRVGKLFTRAWDWHRSQERVQHIGHQAFLVDEVRCTAGPDWAELAAAPPVMRVEMEFLSPTIFRQVVSEIVCNQESTRV